MNQKANRNDKKASVIEQQATPDSADSNADELNQLPEITATDQSAPTETPNPDEGYQLLIEKGEAAKISPKSTGRIFYQLAVKEEDQKLYLRIDSNEGGGLHSREWVDLEKLVQLIMAQGNKAFTSSLFKQVIKGKSSNNASFVAGILRAPDVALIQPTEKGLFQHQAHPELDKNYDRLQKLAPTHTKQ